MTERQGNSRSDFFVDSNSSIRRLEESNFIDLDTARQETDRLASDILALDTKISSKGGFRLESKFKKLVSAFNSAFDFKNGFMKYYQVAQTLGDSNAISNFTTAAQLEEMQILKAIAELRRTDLGVIEAGMQSEVDRLLALEEFYYVSDVSTKIEGLNLYDLLGSVSAADFYKFIFRSLQFARKGNSFPKEDFSIISEDDISQQFPNIARKSILSAVQSVANVFNLAPSGGIQKIASLHLPKQLKESIQKHTVLSQNILKYQRKSSEILLDPNNPEFAVLAGFVADSLSGNQDDKIISLLTLGISSNSDLKNFYRRIDKLLESEDTQDVYRILVDALDDLVGIYQRTGNLARFEDVEEILQDQDMSVIAEPTIPQLDKMVGSIFSKTRNNNDYQIDPNQIDWKLLVIPTTVDIHFNDKPKQFSVDFAWVDDETGEELEISVDMDTAKGKMDWSFLESPDDPKMKDAKKAFMVAVESVLKNMQTQVDEAQKQKQQALKQQTRVTGTGKTKGENREEYVPAEKVKVPREKKAAAPLTTLLEEAKRLEEEAKVKKEIIMPIDEAEIKDLLSAIAEYDYDKVIADIKEFNEGKDKGFKLLTRSGGTLKGEIKIGSLGAHKGIRVILVPDQESSGSGVWRFKPYKIFYRGNAFKGHRKKDLRSF